MNTLVLTATSFALLLAVAALWKERRLRVALQRLLNRMLTYWRSHVPHTSARRDRPADNNPDDGRLR